MQNQKGIASIILILAIVALLGVAGYFAWQYYTITQSPADQPQSQTPPPQAENSPIAQPTDQTAGPALSGVEGWQTYTNTEYGFEFKYPTDFTLSEKSWDETFLVQLKGTNENNSFMPFFSFTVEKQDFEKFIADLEESSGWYEGVNFCENVSSVIDKMENYNLAGTNGKKITLNICHNRGPIWRPQKNRVLFFLEKGELSYTITVDPVVYFYNYDKISDLLVSTFKFIQ